MRVIKAVITAAGRRQRTLPLQTLIDTDGEESPSSLFWLRRRCAGVEQVGIVVSPGDGSGRAVDAYRSRIIYTAGRAARLWPRRLLRARFRRRRVVSPPGQRPPAHRADWAVLGTWCRPQSVTTAPCPLCKLRASLLPYLLWGPNVSLAAPVYTWWIVMEKPAPTMRTWLVVPGLVPGTTVLSGMHVLTPGVMDILAERLQQQPKVTLSDALNELPRRDGIWR